MNNSKPIKELSYWYLYCHYSDMRDYVCVACVCPMIIEAIENPLFTNIDLIKSYIEEEVAE